MSWSLKNGYLAPADEQNILAKNRGILQTRMDQRWIMNGQHENAFWVFSESRWKNEVICLVSMFSYWVMVLKLCIFCNFVLNLARNLIDNSNRQFTYMHLKGLIIHLQEMLLFIMLWLTVSELLEFC